MVADLIVKRNRYYDQDTWVGMMENRSMFQGFDKDRNKTL